MKFKSFSITLLVVIAGFLAISCAKRQSPGLPDNVAYYTCTMHPSVHSKTPGKCPICGMDLVPVYKNSATNAQAASTVENQVSNTDMSINEAGSQPGEFTVPLERQQQIGVTYATVEKRPIQFSIRAVGTVTADKQRQWVYVARVDGYVQKLFVFSPGEIIEKNSPLLTIYSPDLLTTENEYLDLLRARDRARTNNGSTLSQSTDNLVESAKERLHLWNLTDQQIATFEKTRKPVEDLTLESPFRGVVQTLDASQGSKVMDGENLVSVADLSVVWVWARFYQDELPLLKDGLPVTISVDSLPGQKFNGKISVIDPFVNVELRAARVRIDVENPGFKLWPGDYVNVELNIDQGEHLAVPVNAVLPTGQHNIVFVDKGGGKLEPRFIQLGRQFGNFYVVQSGLHEGERIVDSANFLIDAESQIQGALKSW
ncbi:MAG TPA: efflux RND transporter periplasmic adaptor subunit [Verrucomicrobiae bacterium]|nr:efflux RND transporter periplasmic adaptor subunit [Verrucomicrobiae bacterium]